MVACLTGPPPTLIAPLRGAVVLALLLAGLRLHFRPYPVAWPSAGLVWCGLAGGLGFVLTRRWALPLALLYLPFALLGRWYLRATGPEYLAAGGEAGAWPLFGDL